MQTYWNFVFITKVELSSLLDSYLNSRRILKHACSPRCFRKGKRKKSEVSPP